MPFDHFTNPCQNPPNIDIESMTVAGVPRSLVACFQEYNLDTLDPAQHGHLIIERVLAYGDRRELRWLFAQYGRSRVKMWG